MTYELAKQFQERLEAAVSTANAALKQFPRTAMGLTPDHIRVTPEYQSAKHAFDEAFAALRAFNGKFVNRFKNDLAAERRERYQ